MKKLFKVFALSFVAVSALFACSKEMDVINDKPVVEGNKTILTINATNPESVATKTTMVGTTPSWLAGDKITVIYKNKSGAVATAESTPLGSNSSSASFEAELVDANTSINGYAVYPANALSQTLSVAKIPIATEQHPTGTAFDGTSDIMVSEAFTPAGTVSTRFARLGAILRVKVSNATLNDEKILSLSVTAESNLVGDASVSLSDATLTGLTGGSATVTATFEPANQFTVGAANEPNDENKRFVYLIVYPQALAAGSTLTISGETENYSFSRAISLPNKIVLNPGHIVPLNVTVDDPVLKDKVFFEERFSSANGSAGWSGGAGGATFAADNDGWVSDKKYAGASCARFGTGSVAGDVTAPSITIPSAYWGKTIHFTFKAGSWSGDDTDLGIDVDGATVSSTSETLEDAAWKVHSLTLSSVTKSPITISFTKIDRWFLDDVLVYYGSAPTETVLSVSPSDEVNVNFKAGNKDYDVTYTVDGVPQTDWTVSTSSPGFSVEKKGDNSGFTVSYTENTGALRVGTITVSGGGKNVNVRINQSEKAWVDVLTAGDIGMSNYGDWDSLEASTEAIYAGNSTKNGSNDIQLRSSNNSGIVSTTSGGFVSKINVVWGTGNASDGRTLNVYGNNTAYVSAADLYDLEKRGTLIGSVNSKSGTTEVSFDSGDYEYVGLCSSSGALYLASITITWKAGKPSSDIAWKNGSGEVATSGSGTIAFGSPNITTGIPTFYNPNSIPSGLSFTSSDTDVATVTSAGVVTIVGVGETTLTAAFAGDATYRSGSVTYTLTVTDETLRAINKESASNGSFITKVGDDVVTSAKVGQTVTIVATPDANYAVDVITVLDEETGDAIDVTANSFTMPNHSVDVEVTFVRTYLLTVSDVSHGTITTVPASGSRVKETEIVYVTATPDDGFTLNTLTINGDDIDQNDMAFLMPAEDATVVGTFIQQLSAPASPTVTTISSSGFTASWGDVANASGYTWILSSSDTWAGVSGGNTIAEDIFEVGDLDGTGASLTAGTWTLSKSETIEDGTYYLYVVANGDGASYGDSAPVRSASIVLSSAHYYVKVTSTPVDWSGEYLIVWEKSTTEAVVFDGGLTTTLDATLNVVGGDTETTSPITDGKILATSTLNNATFTLGSKLVKGKGGLYITHSANSNGMTNSSTAGNVGGSVSIDGDGYLIVTSGTGSYSALQFNSTTSSGNYRFRFYKNAQTSFTQKKVCLYKYE